MSSQNIFIRGLAMIWHGLDRLRRLLHLILLLLVFLFLIALATPRTPVVPSSAALVLAPQGVLVDQLSGDALQRALALAQGRSFGETLLSDLVESIRSAAGDRRIKALVLQLDGLTGSGLSKLQELAMEIDRFKQSGKPVLAVGSGFDRNQYLLAAHADRILMHPMGLVLIDGYSTYIPYYKSALDKVYVDYNTWTVGEYKSFVEPYKRDDMSPADREARSDYLTAMWNLYQGDVVAERGLEAGSLQRYADDFVSLLRTADGDTGRLALDYGLVDEIVPYDEMRDRIREIVGADEDDESYPQITDRQYVAALHATRLPKLGDRRIGLIVASGTILDGMQPPGAVGSESLSRMIRKAREDDDIRALVLRVDSPGGSAFASDVILRELERFRETGRPLVVSMGSVAASGGYWISMNADEIWASPATLTGSIGVGATFPTFQRTLAAIGITVDGIGTTELAGQMDPMQGVGEDVSEYIQLTIEHTYDEFVTKVAAHRGRDIDSIERAAQGRVWIGSEALELGLVDGLGGLDQAVESAAGRAGLAPGEFAIDRFEPDVGFAEQIALQLLQTTAPWLSSIGFEPALPKSLTRLLDVATEPLAFFESLNDPRSIYAYCFCDVN